MITRKGWAGDAGPLLGTFAEVIEHAHGAALVLVDIPIGLPDARQGQRGCDVAARQALKQRGCCVFPAPIREVVELPAVSGYEEACARQRQLAGSNWLRHDSSAA